MSRTPILIVSILLAATAAPTLADAAVCSDPGMIAERKTFVNKLVAWPDLRCNGNNGIGLCTIKWEGWLYRPTGLANQRPAIIYLHGHGDQGSAKGEPCAIAKSFTQQGYVVFAPLQRGYIANQTNFPGMASTGTHIDNFSGTALIDYLQDEAEDVRDAMNWLKAQSGSGICQVGAFCPMVDPDRVAIMGHSFGGSLTLFANALSPALGHAAAVDISGCVLSWNDNWKAKLEPAIDASQQPVYILQNKNEGSLEPIADLSARAFRIPHRHQAAMFHNVPASGGSYTGNAHSDFVTVAEEVALWAPSVVTFLDTYLP
jgi:dienelactone hydrolase